MGELSSRHEVYYISNYFNIMMSQLSLEMDNKTKGKAISIGVHLLILLLALWPFLRHTDWSKDDTVVIEFAEAVVTETAHPDNVESSNVAKGVKETETTQKNQSAAPQPSKKNIVASSPSTSSITEDVSDITADNEDKVSSENKTDKKPASRNFGNLFGGGEDSEESGKPNGDPNVESLKGLSKGKGTVGRGLNGRQIIYAPTIEDQSQKSGRVIVEICVNKSGIVESASYTQRGSNTTDRYLVNLAEEAAMKWRFSTSEVEKQCGVITIDFKVE